MVSATDDFRVAQVKLAIYNADGVLVEEGNCVLNPIDLNKWSYTVTQLNESPTGCIVSATALDLPGNKGVLETIV